MHDLQTIQALNARAEADAKARLLHATNAIKNSTGITHAAAERAAQALREDGLI